MNGELLKEIELEMVENMMLSDIKGIQKEFMNEPLVSHFNDAGDCKEKRMGTGY